LSSIGGYYPPVEFLTCSLKFIEEFSGKAEERIKQITRGLRNARASKAHKTSDPPGKVLESRGFGFPLGNPYPPLCQLVNKRDTVQHDPSSQVESCRELLLKPDAAMTTDNETPFADI